MGEHDWAGWVLVEVWDATTCAVMADGNTPKAA